MIDALSRGDTVREVLDDVIQTPTTLAEHFRRDVEARCAKAASVGWESGLLLWGGSMKTA